MSEIEQILEERGQSYGKFSTQSAIAQKLKEAMHLNSDNWELLENHHKEALDMIMHKIARILNGNPDFQDSWDDIAGYATLVSKIIQGENP